MKKYILLLALSFIAPALASEVISESAVASAAEKRFTVIDANADGHISKEEYLAAMSKKFDASDSDHDGGISKSELLAIKMKERSEMLVPEKK